MPRQFANRGMFRVWVPFSGATSIFLQFWWFFGSRAETFT